MGTDRKTQGTEPRCAAEAPAAVRVLCRAAAICAIGAALPTAAHASGELIRQAAGGAAASAQEGGGAAGGWTFTKSLALVATYSDNANPNRGGGGNRSDEKQDELFLQAVPYFTVVGDGARVKARGYYSPAFYTGTIGDNPADVSHFLGATGTAELVPDSLFLDANARASVVSEDPTGAGSGSGDYLYGSGNATQAFGASVAMRGYHHLGQTADLYAITSLVTFNSGNQGAVSNAISPSVTMGVKSGVEFQRMPWGVQYRRSELNRSGGGDGNGNSDDSYQSLIGNVSYVLSPTWRLNSSLGYRDDSYQTSRDSTSGVSWRGGATWTPNQRVSLGFGYGYDYFGNSWSLDYRHAQKRVNWFASYSKDLSSVQQEFLATSVFAVTDPTTGLPVVDPTTGQPVLVTQLDPRLTDEVYVLGAFRAGVQWTGVRTRIGLDVNWNERQYELSGDDQTDWGVGFRASRDLSPETTATARFTWKSYDNQGSTGTSVNGGTDERWTAALALSQNVGRQSSVSGIVEHRDNPFGTGSSGDSSSGAENRISLIFNHTF
jgi:uncharacterized protein (PEP-CTERM system associated)